MNSLFLERLLQKIEEKELTQKELAQRTGIRPSSISDYIKGKYAPKQEKVALLAAALEVDPDWLLGYDNMFGKRLSEALDIRKMKAIELAQEARIPRSMISSYISGRWKAKPNNLYTIAKALNVSPVWLMGYDVPMEVEKGELPPEISELPNFVPIEKKKIPLIGTIAAGEPILANQHIEEYLPVDDNIHADFALRIKGDSMINAGIKDGDIVFIRRQEDVQDGQIAAVLIDDDATLKRVYKTNEAIMLHAENPKYKPMIFTDDNCTYGRILGLAIAVLSKL